MSDSAGLVAGDKAAAHLRRQGVRRIDGTAVDGRGAYHCRIARRDRDVFFPAG